MDKVFNPAKKGFNFYKQFKKLRDNPKTYVAAFLAYLAYPELKKMKYDLFSPESEPKSNEIKRLPQKLTNEVKKSKTTKKKSHIIY